MKKLSINGVIGYDVRSKDFIAELDKMKGEEIELDIHSPGGSVFEGLAIYNALKSYKGKVNTKISGLAASMASIIALANGKPKAAKSSVYMIHNAQGFSMGDYRDLEKTAKLLDSVSGMLAEIYSDVTKKSKKSIREMMDNETYMFGAEGVTNGFIDSLYDDEKSDSQDDAVALAQLEIEDCVAKMKNFTEDKSLIAQMSYFINVENNIVKTPVKKESGLNKMEGENMDLKTLKAEHPDLYMEAFQAGASSEQKRVKAHATIAEKRPDMAVLAMKFIASGQSISDDEVQAEYFTAKMTSDDISARKQDDKDLPKTDVSGNKDDKHMDDFTAALKEYQGVE